MSYKKIGCKIYKNSPCIINTDFSLGIIRITKKLKSFPSTHVELGIKSRISHVFDLFYEINENIFEGSKKTLFGFNFKLASYSNIRACIAEWFVC
ncbi:hypothetical protein BpHYR1_052018 [Brachionus plicatilis]|uniref:Uncharacterized protein n=1 Tax=Brachionus plicatilis TaxID=10195 RepID=A0A3M7PM59_BRAPC|nr:hypothetical protein BpHYR1_052018 [Brachionus plicatilis]